METIEISDFVDSLAIRKLIYITIITSGLLKEWLYVLIILCITWSTPKRGNIGGWTWKYRGAERGNIPP